MSNIVSLKLPITSGISFIDGDRAVCFSNDGRETYNLKWYRVPEGGNHVGNDPKRDITRRVRHIRSVREPEATEAISKELL